MRGNVCSSAPSRGEGVVGELIDEELKVNVCGPVETLFNTPSSALGCWGDTKERASVAGMKDVGRRELDRLSVPTDE